MGELIDARSNLPAEIADVFNAEDLAGDLYDGIHAGFAVVSIRGSRWRIAKGGDTEAVLNADGDPVASLECVIVKASRNVSKIFYLEDYAEGDAEAPDCWSVDGLTPDAGATKPQSKTCATCKQNVWGSKITPAGKKTKACGDNRRIAIVPLADIANKKYDGAMLLRIPAASLADLALYGKGMAAKGFPYNAVGTRLGFDVDASYPKLTFRPIKPLDSDQLNLVAEVARSQTVQSILEVPSEIAAVSAAAPAPEPEATVSLDFETEEAAPAAAAAAAAAPAAEPEPVVLDAVAQAEADLKEAKKVAAAAKRKATAAAKKAAAAEPAEEAVTEVVVEATAAPVAEVADEAEESLDALLADLDSLG